MRSGQGFQFKETEISQNLVFVGHKHLQRSGPGWNGHHRLSYSINIMENEKNLEVVVAFMYYCYYNRSGGREIEK